MKIKRGILTNGKMAILLVIAILLIDQLIKIWVKTHMALHESIYITNWFRICFIENNGMAYGMEFGSKLLLSFFRIILISLLIYYAYRQILQKARVGYIICLSLIIAGAIGNVLDSMFYGLFFSASSDYYISYFVPFGSGYAPFLMGKVVDMFYFPLIVTTWPDWVPYFGGNEFIFFSPVFNFADASISVGFVMLLIFYHKELNKLSLTQKVVEDSSMKED